MMETTGRRTGRPRSTAHDRAIVAAVIEELAARPFSKMSMDDVARRAGVAKTTLYRRYPSKHELVIAALDDYFATHFFALQDCGIVDVLLDALEQLVHEIGATPVGRALANLRGEASSDPVLRALLRRHNKRDELVRALEAAVTRGELRADTDVEVVVDVIIGVFPYRLDLADDPFPADYGARVARLILEGCRAGAAR